MSTFCPADTGCFCRFFRFFWPPKPSPRLYLTFSAPAVILFLELCSGRESRKIAGGCDSLLHKGGEIMPITLTFHIFGLVFTIRVKKENRHSAK